MSCTTILVGRKASNDGSTMIARTEDGHFDVKKLIVVNPKDQPKKYKTKISHLEIELTEKPMRYTACPNVDPKQGVWAATGINEANVGITATETITSNPRVLAADPLVEYKKAKTRREKDVPGGIGEEDIVLLVLPYVRTAREGVKRLGKLLEKYGTYESNGIAINDVNEVWWLETIGGHHWMARRIPDDQVVIAPNQFAMDAFDLKDAFGKQAANLCSEDLEEFIRENHLDLNQDGTFNPRNIFGSCRDMDHVYNTPRAWFMGRYLTPVSHRWEGPEAEFTPETEGRPGGRAVPPEFSLPGNGLRSLHQPGYRQAGHVPLHRYQPDRRDHNLPDPPGRSGCDQGHRMDLLRVHDLRRVPALLYCCEPRAGLSEPDHTRCQHGELLLEQPPDRRAGGLLLFRFGSEH